MNGHRSPQGGIQNPAYRLGDMLRPARRRTLPPASNYSAMQVAAVFSSPLWGRGRAEVLLRLGARLLKNATCATPLRFARKIAAGALFPKGRGEIRIMKGRAPDRRGMTAGATQATRGAGGVSRGHYFGVQRALPGFDANLRPAHHNRKSYLPMSQIRKTYRPSRRESPASTRASARAAPLAACVRNPAPL